MHAITLLVLPIVLSACAQLSDIEPVNTESAERVTALSWTLPLIHDTESTQLSLGGRYTFKFIGTSNGSGFGTYSDEIQS